MGNASRRLLNDILATVPPFMIFRIRSVCKKWNLILQDNSFLKFHSNVSSQIPCPLTFWNTSPQLPQCLVFSLPLKTWYKIPLTFLPPWAFWLVGFTCGLVFFLGLDGLPFKTLVCNPLMQSWRTLPSMHYNQQRQLIMVVDRSDKLFKVIAISDIYGDKSLPTEVYDSKTDKCINYEKPLSHSEASHSSTNKVSSAEPRVSLTPVKKVPARLLETESNLYEIPLSNQFSSLSQ